MDIPSLDLTSVTAGQLILWAFCLMIVAILGFAAKKIGDMSENVADLNTQIAVIVVKQDEKFTQVGKNAADLKIRVDAAERDLQELREKLIYFTSKKSSRRRV